MQETQLLLQILLVVIGVIELAVTLDKKVKRRVDNVLHIPEEDREP